MGSFPIKGDLKIDPNILQALIMIGNPKKVSLLWGNLQIVRKFELRV